MSMSCRRFAHMAAADALGTMALLSAGLTISCFTNAVAGDVKANVPRGSLAVYNGPNDGQMIKWVGPDSGQLALPRLEPERETTVVLRVVPSGMSQIRKVALLVPIRSLHLSAVRIDDDDLEFIVKSCPRLGQLTLHDSSSLDADELKDLKGDEPAMLGTKALSNSALGKLTGFKDLKTLDISGLTLPPNRLGFVVGLRQLEHLGLHKLHIVDDDLQQLGKLPDLKVISLSNTAVTGEGLRFLKECHALRILDLSWTAISDTALRRLSREDLPLLDVLMLDGCKVAAPTIAALRKAFPSAKIIKSDTSLDSAQSLLPPNQSDVQVIRLHRCACELLHSTGVVKLNGIDNTLVGATLLLHAKPACGNWLFSELALVKGLKHLDLENCSLPAGALEHLRECSDLERIRLAGSSVSDADLRHLIGLRHLGWIDLRKTEVTDAAMAHLSRLATLEEVQLDYTNATDRCIRALAALPRLRILGLQACRISDEGAAQLAGLSTLEVLALDGTQVTDQGVGSLAKLPRLSWLSLDLCNVTDIGVMALLDAPSLQSCQLDGLAVSEAVAAKLRRHLSEVRAKSGKTSP